ncbi:hypothetical protein ACI7YQ_14925 [Alteromonas marina]|uniref:hypothetical protein n=1 Tax=unclassified Alteromonas TaxID=2614992 RepID=UPI0012E57777|nr:hypothetical protein [Alteromonas sp. KUL150]GFD71985.1 hypothetical protein KUL113_14050 [Tenacibaculum sp. KUL113]GFD84723.1 hypothetical protein KUL150_07820 [Alteromonas sp. KUL150]
MIDRPVSLPTPLSILVSKSLQLCEYMLPVCDVFYPFAAIYEKGRIGCIFNDEDRGKKRESQLIEQLQWRIIDTTTDTDSYSVLVYAATVNTQNSKTLDAIAIATATPDHEERLILYPYYKVDGKVVISPPIDAVTR